MLQVLNRDSHAHSNKYAKMIRIYEGDKENRDCIEHTFGIWLTICKTLMKISTVPFWEAIKYVPTVSRQVALTESSQLIKSFSYEVHQCPSECTRLKQNNVYFSNSCKLCRKYQTDSSHLKNLLQNPDRNRDNYGTRIVAIFNIQWPRMVIEYSRVIIQHSK